MSILYVYFSVMVQTKAQIPESAAAHGGFKFESLALGGHTVYNAICAAYLSADSLLKKNASLRSPIL